MRGLMENRKKGIPRLVINYAGREGVATLDILRHNQGKLFARAEAKNENCPQSTLMQSSNVS